MLCIFAEITLLAVHGSRRSPCRSSQCSQWALTCQVTLTSGKLMIFLNHTLTTCVFLLWSHSAQGSTNWTIPTCVALLYKSLSLNIIERSAVKLCFFFSSPKYFPDFLRKASEILRKAILWWRHLMLLQVFYFLIDKPLQSSSCCLWKRIRVRPGVCFAQNRMPYVYLSFS